MKMREKIASTISGFLSLPKGVQVYQSEYISNKEDP